eukprot:scaffold1284_cov108-Cylindrotheca_fusiformis.AAC.32
MNNIPTTSPPADAFVGDETKDVELQASEPSDATLNSAENLEGQSDHEVVEEKTGFSTVKFKTIITGTLNGTQKLEGISTFPKASVAGNTEDVEVPTSESSNGTLSRGENLEEDKSSVDDNSDAADDAAVKRKRPGFTFTTKTFVAAVKSKRRGFASTTKTLVAVAGCFFFVVAIVLAFIFGLKGNDPDGVLGEVLPPFLLEPQEPSASPSFAPSGNPTAIHSSAPSPFPSSAPTLLPTAGPTRSAMEYQMPDPTPEPSSSPTCSTEGTIEFYSKPDCTGSKKLSVKVPDGRGETTPLDRMSHYDVWSAAFVGPISKGVFLTVGRDESGRPFTSVGEMVVETDIPCGATVCVKSFESFPANGGGRYGSVRLQSSLVGGDRLGGGDLNYGKIYNPHHPWATAVIGSPKWGDYFSEENGGWSQPRDNRYPVVGMTASWGWGDNKKYVLDLMVSINNMR